MAGMGGWESVVSEGVSGWDGSRLYWREGGIVAGMRVGCVGGRLVVAGMGVGCVGGRVVEAEMGFGCVRGRAVEAEMGFGCV